MDWRNVRHYQTLRGTEPETTHPLAWVLMDADAKPLAASVDNQWATWSRSTVKPFQLLASVGEMALSAYPPQRLAIACASHSGEAAHLPWVTQWLDEAGLSPDWLQCGCHPPLTRWSEPGSSPLHHNCSGKHAAMLWACHQQGWDLASYRATHHPLQQVVVETVSRWCNVRISPHQLAADGCGVPTFYLPLWALASGYLRLLQDERGCHLLSAMKAYPELVAGQGRIDTVIMQASQGALVSKVGAAGLIVVTHPQKMQVLALKVVDGNQTAREQATVALLLAMDWLATEPLDEAASRHDLLQERSSGRLLTC